MSWPRSRQAGDRRLGESVGDAYVNAMMETISGLHKAECIRTTIFHDGPYKTIADIEYATAGEDGARILDESTRRRLDPAAADE